MINNENRKMFQILPSSENSQFLEDGLKIYKELACKYETNSVVGCDNILNALCASLMILIKNHVDEQDYKQFIHLIYKTLNQNI